MSQKTDTVLRIAHALVAIALGISSNLLYTLVPSETWVRVAGTVGAYPLLFLGVLVLSGRGPGGRLMLSGKGPSSRFMLTRRRWKYAVVTGLAAVTIIVGAISALQSLISPALPLFQWLLIAFLANLLEPVRKKQLLDRA
jgi:hypothetical protein